MFHTVTFHLLPYSQFTSKFKIICYYKTSAVETANIMSCYTNIIQIHKFIFCQAIFHQLLFTFNNFHKMKCQIFQFPMSQPLWHTLQQEVFYCKGFLALYPIPKLENNPPVDCLFKLFSITLQLQMPSCLSTTWECNMYVTPLCEWIK